MQYNQSLPYPQYRQYIQQLYDYYYSNPQRGGIWHASFAMEGEESSEEVEKSYEESKEESVELAKV